METGLISFCTNYCDNQGIMDFTGTETLANEPKYAKFLQVPIYHPNSEIIVSQWLYA